MRFQDGLSVLLVWAVALIGAQVAAQTVVDDTAVSGLSTCVLQCTSTVFTTYDCQLSQPCFCENMQVQDAMMDCLQVNDCSFSDQLASTRFRASRCDTPTRDRSQLLSVVAYVLFALATLFTLARLASRIVGAGLGWDDFVAVTSYAPLVGFFVAGYFTLQNGMGKEIWTLRLGDIVDFNKWFYIASVLYVLVVFGTKISLVLFYLRTWPTAGGPRMIWWISLGLLVAALISFEVSVIAQCRPIASQWDSLQNANLQSQCVERSVLLWALAGVDIGFNVLVLLVPIRSLIRMKTTLWTTAGILFIYLVGLAVTAISIVRIFHVRDFTSTFNTTYSYSFFGLYSGIEVYLSQICCCAPGMAGLATRLSASSFSSLGSKKSSRDSIRISAPLQTAERHDFATINAPREAPDLEKAKYSGESNYILDDEDGAPPPVIKRSSHNSQALHNRSSFEPIIEGVSNSQSQRPMTYRSSATTATRNYRDSGTDARTPDILYQDHQNQLRLEIHDPPDAPIKARLQYVDKASGVHDLELQGRPRSHSQSRSRGAFLTRPSTAILANSAPIRPHTAPSPGSEEFTTTTEATSPSSYNSTSTTSSRSISYIDSPATTTAPPHPSATFSSASKPPGSSGSGSGTGPGTLSPRLSALLQQSHDLLRRQQSTSLNAMGPTNPVPALLAPAPANRPQSSSSAATAEAPRPASSFTTSTGTFAPTIASAAATQNNDTSATRPGNGIKEESRTVSEESEAAKLADLVNAHKILTEEGGMVGSDGGITIGIHR
ncbi:hypothetical protein CERZMDRAFT_119012 [Cercospora zeae-maydis SCOH1-5]|uniref:Rhodopsin domain-containing protein n=1 Tax=Cercospora zeae-maydis SCOH1-5 TaxID=717836 RepID=A0A6A6F2A5_9PEZI|nr:hypothetical protein CERZMDRAFT_119012 [Cercospora zeae-maydis SCOH1-5]